VAPPFELLISEEASQAHEALAKSDPRRYKRVQKALGLLAANPRYPSLQSHPYHGTTGPDDCTVFESYVENNTPAAYRIFWHYGPGDEKISILSIVPHPD
jgi:hypothetical protein